MELIALETRRKMGQVNFRKDFWDCYHTEKKNWPIADWSQEKIAENISPPVPFSFLKWWKKDNLTLHKPCLASWDNQEGGYQAFKLQLLSWALGRCFGLLQDY